MSLLGDMLELRRILQAGGMTGAQLEEFREFTITDDEVQKAIAENSAGFESRPYPGDTFKMAGFTFRVIPYIPDRKVLLLDPDQLAEAAQKVWLHVFDHHATALDDQEAVLMRALAIVRGHQARREEKT